MKSMVKMLCLASLLLMLVCIFIACDLEETLETKEPTENQPTESENKESSHEHTVEILSAVDATCMEIGKTVGAKCSVCDKILVVQNEIPALGHTVEIVSAIDATCTEVGKTAGAKCSVCEEVLVAQNEIPMLGHTEVTIPAVDATYTESGWTEGKKCSVCGEILVAQEEIPPTDPNPNAWSQKNDKVYVGADNVNLRRGASTSAAVYGTVDMGTELNRLRTNGVYDEVFYSGETLYIRSDLVTSNKEDLDFSNILATRVEITFRANFNLRSDPVVYSDNTTGQSNVVFTYDTEKTDKINGTFTKVAVSANGVWYKLSFTGTAYGKTYTNAILYIKVIIGGQSYTNYINDPSVFTGGQGVIG